MNHYNPVNYSNPQNDNDKLSFKKRPYASYNFYNHITFNDLLQLKVNNSIT